MTNLVLPCLAPPVPVSSGTACGWLHGSGVRGVLMCGAAGFEGAAAYQSWRVLADVIAARGYTVLRIDYPGEGDSGDADTAFADGAVKAIRAGAAMLRGLTGPTIDIIGLRLGCLLADTALGDDPEIGRRVMLAPVASGRALLRETRLAAQMFASQPGRAATQVQDGVALCGHLWTAADCSSVEALRFGPLPDRALLAVLTEGMAAPAFSAETETLPFPGYGGMMSPAEAMPPLETFSAVADWLGTADGLRQAPPPPAAPICGPGFQEERLRFGPDGTLAGTWCQPEHWREGRCVILPNAGANTRFGWARMSVAQARALARQGVASLRVDLSGIGDSDFTGGSPRKSVYDPVHLDNMDAAIALARGRGAARILLAGLCSGGYIALHAADRNPAVAGVVAVNVLKFIWRHGIDDLDTIEREATQSSRTYTRQALSSGLWKRLFSGAIAPSRIVAVAAMLAGKAARAALGAFGWEGPLGIETQQARAIVARLSERGIAVSFVHGTLDASRDEAERHFGRDGRFLTRLPGITTELIDDTDHELSPKHARDRLEVILADRALKV